MTGLKTGDVFDARERMQSITMRVILTAVFGLHEGEDYRHLERLLHQSLSIRAGRFGSLLLFFPCLGRNWGAWSPGGKFQGTEMAMETLLLKEIALKRMAAENKKENEKPVDMLSLLLTC